MFDGETNSCYVFRINRIAFDSKLKQRSVNINTNKKKLNTNKKNKMNNNKRTRIEDLL